MGMAHIHNESYRKDGSVSTGKCIFTLVLCLKMCVCVCVCACVCVCVCVCVCACECFVFFELSYPSDGPKEIKRPL